MTEKKDVDFGILASNFISLRREQLIELFITKPIYQRRPRIFENICDHASTEIAGVYKFLFSNHLISESLFDEWMGSCEDCFSYDSIKRTVQLREELFKDGK